jgi:8-oxo-dGTP pyrophosphatase MutT (NUDIX family)
MRIYLNERTILLKKTRPEDSDYCTVGSKAEMSLLYDGFEADPTHKRLVFFSNNYRQMKEDFFSLFTTVEAAGGYVKNERNEILFIFRRGHWDLPKGKLIKKSSGIERRPDAAIREVKEETGIERLEIIGKKAKTYHIFFEKRERYLKKTWWYEMRAPKDQALKPQAEEDITDVQWIAPADLEKVYELLYPSLKKLFM